ncbi:zinc ribbon domain-containing protein [Halococcus sp. IIIV-5B]|uniref:zinc ribbon domain-containing protein n=1 Tax=Halococcus sp. IIIV-5B TaxID=2321230 RepID=UPI0018F58394|nr:hypothetical protein [Halococcus sp. IIIV-5B]
MDVEEPRAEVEELQREVRELRRRQRLTAQCLTCGTMFVPTRELGCPVCRSQGRAR